MAMRSGTDWQLEYLHQLRQILEFQQEQAKRFWERTRWLRWLTFPAYLSWLGVWLLAYRSEEIWQAMWTVKTTPSRATKRQKVLGFFALPRLRRLAAVHLWWLRHGNYFSWVICTAVVASVFIYTVMFFIFYLLITGYRFG